MVVLALCAVTVTVLFVKRELSPKPDPSARFAPKEVKGWEEFAVSEMRLGSSNSAPVRIVTFSDFQCPFCRQFAFALDSVLMRYKDSVTVFYRNFPLSQIHPMALPTAYGAQCAAKQARFPEYHDHVFAHQDSLETIKLADIATAIGINDIEAFNTCVTSPEARRLVSRDSIAGEKLGLGGTPTVVLNGWKFVGTPTLAQLDSAVRHELDRTRDRR